MSIMKKERDDLAAITLQPISIRQTTVEMPVKNLSFLIKKSSPS
jgi:hypothetical protein